MAPSRTVATYFSIILYTILQVTFADASDGIVAAYIPEYRFYADVESAISCCLTDVMLFSASVEIGGRVDDHWLPPNEIRRVRKAADEVPDRTVNVLLTVGGAGRSSGFAVAAASKQNRLELVKQLIDIVKRYELDGIDFDWEAPRNEAEMENYSLLLKLASKSLSKLNKLTTVALHPGQMLADIRLPNGKKQSVINYIDRVHLMAYDMNGKQGHSSLVDSQNSVKFLFTQSQVPAQKIVLGIPSYSRSLTNIGEVKTYAEIIDSMGKERDVDWLSISERTSDGFVGSSPSTVTEKALWSREVGLGGVMFWELGQDKLKHPASLITAAASAMKKKQTKKETNKQYNNQLQDL